MTLKEIGKRELAKIKDKIRRKERELNLLKQKAEKLEKELEQWTTKKNL